MAERSEHYGMDAADIQALIKSHVSHAKARASAVQKSGGDWQEAIKNWGDDLQLKLLLAEKKLAEDGWQADFPVLVDKNDRPVPARLVRAKFGTVWALTDGQGNFTGAFLKRDKKALVRYHFREVRRMCPAWARIRLPGSTGSEIEILHAD